MKPFTTLAVAVFAIVGLLHLLRVLLGWGIVIGGVSIPDWASVVAFVASGILATMVAREARR
jgi:hypothetical protein